jgi:hypothetical protein
MRGNCILLGQFCTNFTAQVHILIVKTECLIVRADSDQILGTRIMRNVFKQQKEFILAKKKTIGQHFKERNVPLVLINSIMEPKDKLMQRHY